jgi:cardiolipin synthase
LRASGANLLSAARLAAAGAWFAVFAANPGSNSILGAIAVAASLSDFVDGRLARWLGTSGAAGRWLDGFADIVFVLTVIGSEASAGVIPSYIPILIAVSFAQYVLDSIILARSESGPIRSRLGHWGGVINYALALTLSFAPPPHFAGTVVRTCAPLLALYYVAAIAERVAMYARR